MKVAMRKIFNDSVFDGLIYWVVNNIKSVMYVLWVVVSCSVGMTLGYYLAGLGKPEEVEVLTWAVGGGISILIMMFISFWNDFATIDYGRTRLADFVMKVKDTYDEKGL
jgi:hypothetical protein